MAHSRMEKCCVQHRTRSTPGARPTGDRWRSSILACVAALGASILDFSSTDSSPRFDSLVSSRCVHTLGSPRAPWRYDGRTRTHGNHGATPSDDGSLPARLGRQPKRLAARRRSRGHAAALLVAGEAVGAPAAAREQILLASD